MTIILVVEDDRYMARLIHKMLELGPYQVASVENGLDALKWLQRERADLVISDLWMPVLDGLRLQQALTADVHLRQLPILFTSTMQVARCSIEQPGCSFLLKPFGPMALLATVQRLLQASYGSAVVAEPRLGEEHTNGFGRVEH